MFQYIGAAVSLVALLAAFWGGYKWGSHEVEHTKAELDAVRTTAKLVQDSDADFRKRLDSALAAQSSEHESKMAELKQRDAQDLANLQTAKSQSDQNAAAYRAQAATSAARVTALQAKLAGATTPAQKAQLQQEIAAGTAAKDNSLRLASAEECLRLPVPGEIVTSLNLSTRP